MAKKDLNVISCPDCQRIRIGIVGDNEFSAYFDGGNLERIRDRINKHEVGQRCDQCFISFLVREGRLNM